MTIIRPLLPFLWWLNPWSCALQRHKAAIALRKLCDTQDKAIIIQTHVISDQSEEISFLRQRVADMNDAIIRGTAIVPDAKPHE